MKQWDYLLSFGCVPFSTPPPSPPITAFPVVELIKFFISSTKSLEEPLISPPPLRMKFFSLPSGTVNSMLPPTPSSRLRSQHELKGGRGQPGEGGPSFRPLADTTA